MIVDTSALIAIFYDEPEAPRFAKLIEDAEFCRLSVANHLEMGMVIDGQKGADAAAQAEVFLHRAGISLEPVTLEQGRLARQAFRDYGRGRHKAALNFGDCFAYALAKAMGEPLLYKGEDFSHTDIAGA